MIDQELDGSRMVYVAYPKYLFAILLSLKVPLGAPCPSTYLSVPFNQFGLSFVSRMITR